MQFILKKDYIISATVIHSAQGLRYTLNELYGMCLFVGTLCCPVFTGLRFYICSDNTCIHIRIVRQLGIFFFA